MSEIHKGPLQQLKQSVFTMNGRTIIPSYAEKLDGFRRSDEERDALIAEIIRDYEELQLKYAEKCDDFNNEVESRRMWQTKASYNAQALAQHKQVSVRTFMHP